MAESPLEETEIQSSAFQELYKYSNRDTSFSLHKKRTEFLQKQKDKRNEAFNEKRDLSELFVDDNPERMEFEENLQRKVYKKFPFGYKIMGAEWLTEIPEDFGDNWLIKFCPEGVRFLVVASKASTTCYYKNGKVAFNFKSKLPGGTNDSAHKFTVLDCVFNKKLNVLFIFDVLAWNSLSLLDAEAHLRFCWLKSKLDESPEMFKINQNFDFVLMDYFPSEISLLQENLFTHFCVKKQEVPYEGVLFYHKEGHYNFGKSPLVGWLKSFMVPEVFNIDVSPLHLVLKPENYESIPQYLASKKRKKKVIDSEMKDLEEEEEKIVCDL